MQKIKQLVHYDKKHLLRNDAMKLAPFIHQENNAETPVSGNHARTNMKGYTGIYDIFCLLKSIPLMGIPYPSFKCIF